MYALLDPMTLASVFAGVLGLIGGSFLNVVIHRGPSQWGLVDGESRGTLAAPRSYCPACKTPIPAKGLVPLVSYIIQKGRCRACGATIPARYPIVEALGALVALAAYATFGWTWAALAAALFGLALIALAFIDLETGYLPDAITLPLIAVGLVQGAFNLTTGFAEAAVGAAAGYVAFRSIGFAYEKTRGREGLGQGDAKLLAAIGAFTGWMFLPVVIFVGAVSTLAATMASGGVRRDEPIPFGPGLCAAGFLALMAAPRLTGL